MTRFLHDQFAKQYLSELLSPLGTVETSKEIHAEGRQIDLFFTPSPSGREQRKDWGLLGQLITTPALLEPFRNPVAPSDIRTCMIKLFVIISEFEREAKRTKSSANDTELPQLWILTPTASPNLLQRFGFQPSPKEGEQGIYYLGTALKTAIIAIHQLSSTPETLWLRLLGRGRVQQRAIGELEALPRENRFRSNVVKLVKELISLLAKRQNKERDLDRDDEELIMTLTQMYEEAMAEIRQQAKEEGLQQGKQEGLQQGKQEGLQQGFQQGKQEGREEGEKEATQRLIENIFRVRFGEIDESLAAIATSILKLPSEEFTPLLLQLSREALIDRFQNKEE
ncbi:MAG: hypothetical protein J7647_27720 [Cyanobacteria bacterium SBLK]|nr:hypothetical protein [Cyanobacteria bacterium SBLK]